MKNLKWNKGLESVLSFGRYKGCRIGFLIDHHPKYIETLVARKILILDKESKKKLNNAIDKMYWDQFITS